VKVYLAGFKTIELYWDKPTNEIFILSSFMEHKGRVGKYVKQENHILDSGAFSYLNGRNIDKVDWNNYIEEYANFINKYDIDLYFELDIDPIVGLNEVERLRNKLEKLTNKQSIPVWHKSRGLEYWVKMVKDYDYVAIGGIVTKEIKPKEHNVFTKLIKIANENNCKVHGLGFTSFKGLKKYRFYSVDSTSWTSGNRFGAVFRFNGNGMDIMNTPIGKRVISRKTLIHNFKEWVKFQQYAKEYL